MCSQVSVIAFIFVHVYMLMDHMVNTVTIYLSPEESLIGIGLTRYLNNVCICNISHATDRKRGIAIFFSQQWHKYLDYRKNSKIWDTSNNCHNCPKNRNV